MATFVLTIRDTDPETNDGNDLFVNSTLDPIPSDEDVQESKVTNAQYLALTVRMLLAGILDANIPEQPEAESEPVVIQTPDPED